MRPVHHAYDIHYSLPLRAPLSHPVHILHYFLLCTLRVTHKSIENISCISQSRYYIRRAVCAPHTILYHPPSLFAPNPNFSMALRFWPCCLALPLLLLLLLPVLPPNSFLFLSRLSCPHQITPYPCRSSTLVLVARHISSPSLRLCTYTKTHHIGEPSDGTGAIPAVFSGVPAYILLILCERVCMAGDSAQKGGKCSYVRGIRCSHTSSAMRLVDEKRQGSERSMYFRPSYAEYIK